MPSGLSVVGSPGPETRNLMTANWIANRAVLPGLGT
jgi:hypothetical protein